MVPVKVLINHGCQTQSSIIGDLGFCTNPRVNPTIKYFFIVSEKVPLS